MNNKANIVAALLLACLIGNAQAMYRHHGRTFDEVAAGRKNVRTIQLLNQLCNESQDQDTMKRDACYGCFFRASIAPRGFPMLSAMSSCAEKYLNNTDYNHCQTYLKGAVVQVDPAGTPMVVYCTFLECIRQVNKDTLAMLKHVNHAVEGVSKAERMAVRRKRSAMVTRQYLVSVQETCAVKPATALQRAGFRAAQMHRNWRHRSHRSFRRDSRMRNRGPRNVFQFFIDGEQPREAFRQYNRMYPGQNQMRRYESHHWRHQRA